MEGQTVTAGVEVSWSLFVVSAAWAGDGAVVGYAFDAEGPVADARVFIDGRTLSTDASGAFVARLPQGTWTVQVEAPGRTGGRLAGVPVALGEVTELRITLSEEGLPRSMVLAPSGTHLRMEGPSGDVELTVRNGDAAPVSDVQVWIPGRDGPAVTDANGAVQLTASAGPQTWTLVAPKAAPTRVQIEVPPGASVAHTATMLPPPTRGSFPADSYVQGTVEAVLAERRLAPALLDLVSAQDMLRAGDRDAAQGLRRTVGVALRDRRFVEVRGMRVGYATTLLNGAVAPSPEPALRQVPLDLFPASILDRVVVQKSWTPDRPGAFGSGLVDLRTVRPPTGFSAGISVLGGYRAGTTGVQALRHSGTGTDWLTFGARGRGLPEEVQSAVADRSLDAADAFAEDGFSPEEIETLGEAMPNRWATETRWVPPDFRLDAWLGHGGRVGQTRFGVLGAAMLRNEWFAYRYSRTFYTPPEGTPTVQSQFDFEDTTGRAGLGAFLTAGAEVGHNHGVRYVFALSRDSESLTRQYEGFDGDTAANLRVLRLQWIERRLANHQLHGFHRGGPVLVEWRGVMANGGREEPDRREARYDQVDDTFLLSARPEGNQRLFAESVERYREGAVDLTLRQGRRHPVGTQWKVGALASQRARDVGARRFRFFHNGPIANDPDVLERPIERVFTPPTIGPDGFTLQEFTRPTDHYAGEHALTAGYGMGEVWLGSRLRLMGGLRVEHSEQRVRTFELFGDGEVLAEVVTTDVLPAAAATLALGQDVQLRFSSARTVNRPELRQLSPSTYLDVTQGLVVMGNPELQRAQITHLDARLEWFVGPMEVVSATVFRKWLDAPIEVVVFPGAVLSASWANAEAATTTGVELEGRKNLPTDLYVAGNLTLVGSTVRPADLDTTEGRPLGGQSPWMLNAQVGWDPPGADQLTVLYRVNGPRVAGVGAFALPDTFERPVHQVDVFAQKQIGPSWALLLQAGNVLDARAVRTLGPDQLPVDDIRTGRTFAAGLTWTP